MNKKTFMLLCVIRGFIEIVSAQTANEIMKKVDERYQGDTAQYSLVMTLQPKKGSPRVREISYYFKDAGDTEKILMFFRSPKDVAGTGYLVFSYDADKDNDAWLYLPAVERVRRIASSSSGDSFMGTDFSYEDINGRPLTKDAYAISGEASVDGEPCWIIEAKAKDAKETVARRLISVRKDNHVIAAARYFDRRDKETKRLTVSGITQIDGIWTAVKMEMAFLSSGHSTSIEIKNPRFNLPLDDSLFTTNTLERGIR